jgi:hypothetical protein
MFLRRWGLWRNGSAAKPEKCPEFAARARAGEVEAPSRAPCRLGVVLFHPSGAACSSRGLVLPVVVYGHCSTATFTTGCSRRASCRPGGRQGNPCAGSGQGSEPRGCLFGIPAWSGVSLSRAVCAARTTPFSYPGARRCLGSAGSFPPSGLTASGASSFPPTANGASWFFPARRAWNAPFDASGRQACRVSSRSGAACRASRCKKPYAHSRTQPPWKDARLGCWPLS